MPVGREMVPGLVHEKTVGHPGQCAASPTKSRDIASHGRVSLIALARIDQGVCFHGGPLGNYNGGFFLPVFLSGTSQ
ncbi:MAG TPA: hypothetical protein VGR93_10805 [Candidatus Acidoferrales bacterium]|nr:hypothetical protein [Candidatus Acidoferrales bacterium]